MAKASKHRTPPPRRTAEDRRYDAVELTDEDLEIVVGGLSFDAAQAHARYLGLVPIDDTNLFPT